MDANLNPEYYNFYDARQLQEYLCALANKAITKAEIILDRPLTNDEKETLTCDGPAFILEELERKFPNCYVVKDAKYYYHFNDLPKGTISLLEDLEALKGEFGDFETEFVNGVLTLTPAEIKKHYECHINAKVIHHNVTENFTK